MTVALAKREKSAVTLAEWHALYLRIIGVRCTRFGEDCVNVRLTIDDAVRAGWSSWYFRTRVEQEYRNRLEYVLGDALLTVSSACVSLMCLVPRFPRA